LLGIGPGSASNWQSLLGVIELPENAHLLPVCAREGVWPKLSAIKSSKRLCQSLCSSDAQQRKTGNQRKSVAFFNNAVLHRWAQTFLHTVVLVGGTGLH
jgi:hypothetical protein